MSWQVDLSKPSVFVVVVSTTGNGDVPENGEMFWRWVRRRQHPKTLLEHVYFAVLALGDSNYTKFWYGMCAAHVALGPLSLRGPWLLRRRRGS